MPSAILHRRRFRPVSSHLPRAMLRTRREAATPERPRVPPALREPGPLPAVRDLNQQVAVLADAEQQGSPSGCLVHGPRANRLVREQVSEDHQPHRQRDSESAPDQPHFPPEPVQPDTHNLIHPLHLSRQGVQFAFLRVEPLLQRVEPPLQRSRTVAPASRTAAPARRTAVPGRRTSGASPPGSAEPAWRPPRKPWTASLPLHCRRPSRRRPRPPGRGRGRP